MNNACIVVDFRKSRIRIFKQTLQELLYPKYVRLLVNPNEKTVAVQVTDSADTRAHRIPNIGIKSMRCYEIYSRSLLNELSDCGAWNSNNTYKIHASVCLNQQCVIFKMDQAVLLEASR